MTAACRRILTIVTSSVLMLSSVTGCSSHRPATTGAAGSAATSTAAPTPTGSGPSVIVPGRPGEPGLVRPADQLRQPGLPDYNSMDVWFVRMMIPHHTQALQMAALAPDRAADPRIRAVADRIRASQAPEIRQLRAWLEARALPLDAAGHDHGAMRGMQTPEAMRKLAAARGAEFDRLFVAMMVDHHQGAVETARDVLKVGADATIADFATAVAVEQAVEIDRLRELTDS